MSTLNDTNGRLDKWGYPEGINPEFEKLYLENSLLRGDLAALEEEIEYVSRFIIPTVHTNYMIKIGALKTEWLQLSIDVSKIRRRIALVRSNKENGSLIADDAAINYCIEIEFENDDERLKNELGEVENAKRQFASTNIPEDMSEIRSIYRLLARKMNPVVNTDQSSEAKSFWPSIHSAYVNGDLFHLKALLLMSEDYPDSYDFPNNIGRMKKNREDLIKNISVAKRKLENVKLHPAMSWKDMLENQERLTTEQQRINDDINKLRVQKSALEELLSSLELKLVKK